MLLQFIFAASLILVVKTQENSKQQNDEPKQDKEIIPQLVYLGIANSEFPQQNEIQSLDDAKEFYADQPYSPDPYGLTYLEPQHQAEKTLPRLQPQILLYGPGGQGQPILINPGNPPGNYLIPQGPGPNVIVRNNPQHPQGSLFPIAGYPKPAHIPPIEKDAEEIPTNPANIPPLPSEARPVIRTKNKPEKLETFNESAQPDSNMNVNNAQLPQGIPNTEALKPGQRFFVLNGDQLFNYPFETQPQVQQDLPTFRYTNIKPFPQNPPQLVQTFTQDTSQILQGDSENSAPITLPSLPPHNYFLNTQQLGSQPQGQLSRQPNQSENDGGIKTSEQYFKTSFSINPQLYLYPQNYPINQQSFISIDPFNKNRPTTKNAEEITSKDEVVQPQMVGQFRFTPSTVQGLLPFKYDFENDAIVVEASFDENRNDDARGGNLKSEPSENTTPQQTQKESETSMAQAGPQATAIAGPGGVAGSAPRGTAIVGKGGLAVSSPQATAVAGTKDEDKKKRPIKINT